MEKKMNTNLTFKRILFGALALTLVLSAFAVLPVSAVQASAGEVGLLRGGRGNGNGTGTGTTTPGGLGASGYGSGSTMGYGRGMGAALNTGAALTPLTDAEKALLEKAILEEYGALNLYRDGIAQFGDVAPFSQIARSEEQHVNMLVRLAEKYGVLPPANPGGTDATFTDLTQACQAGVDAEIADAALYDELIPQTSHADLIQVFTNLQAASLENHLPAFQVCQ